MSIGSIVVDLLARTGSFETDMARAAKTAEKRAKEIDTKLSEIGSSIGTKLGLAVSAAAVGITAWGKSLIDGLDALNDVADATGSTIEKISALEDVAGRTGASMDVVTGAMVKFNAGLKEADGKNGVSMALKAIGLDAAELKKMDPADALLKTAQALAVFADDGSKARVVQELFGKSIKEAAPFLKDLAEQTELVGKVTAEQTQAAENFNKQLFALEKNAKDAGRALLSDLLPAMTKFLQNAREIASIGGFGAIVKDAAKDMVGLGKLSSNSGADINNLMRERDRLQKDLAFAQKNGRPTRGLDADIAENAKLLEISRIRQRNEVATLYSGDYSDAVSRRMAPRKSIGDLPVAPKGGGASDSEKKTKAESYLDTLSKQLNKAKELTAYETALDEIQSGRLGKVTAMEKDLILTRARQIDDAKALAKYNDLTAEATKQREADLIKLAEQQEQSAASLVEGNTELKNQIGLIGKNAEEQAKLEQARIAETIAQKEQLLAAREIEGAYQRELDAIRSTIASLKERSDLIGQKGVAEKLADDAKKADEFAQQLGASFESAFEKAILEGGKLSDVLSGLAQDVAKLWLRQNVTGPIAQMLGGSAGSGGSSSGGGVGNWLSAIVTAVGGWFGGFKAAGGPVSSGKGYIVGENGPEWFTPNTSGRIIPNHALGGGGGPPIVQQYIVGDVATRSQVRNSVQNSQRQSAAALQRSTSYGGALA